MENITIIIPKKMLSKRYAAKQLILVEPKELTKEARQRWEIEDAKEASREGRREWKEGKTRQIASLKELM
ncbi:MAG: hypothetical protein Q8R40_06170 [bacterium]|nr:hypothetical protein [bacterium]